MSLFFLPSTTRCEPRVRLTAIIPLVLTVGLAAGCASGGATEAASGGSSSSESEEIEIGANAGPGAENEYPTSDDLQALLSEWADHLEEESAADSTGALRAFTRLQSNGADGEHGENGPDSEQVLLAMAMIHLHPESPLLDRERGLEHLSTLEASFPEAMEGIQAGVLRHLLRELDQTAAEAEEGGRLVEELSRTVAEFREAIEQLKRIDLNRRPVRELRGDTLPNF